MNLEEYVTTAEVSKELDLCAARVVQLIVSGHLEAIKRGRDWLVTKRSIAHRKTVLKAYKDPPYKNL